MKESPSAPSENENILHIADKLNFIEQGLYRLKKLSAEQKDLSQEIRGAFKVLFAFGSEPGALTTDWMRRIDEAISYYEDPNSVQQTQGMPDCQPLAQAELR